jgi:hypothetical protein
MSPDIHCVCIPNLTLLTTMVHELSNNYTNNVLITVSNYMSHPATDIKIKNSLITFGMNGTPLKVTILCICNSMTSFCKQVRWKPQQHLKILYYQSNIDKDYRPMECDVMWPVTEEVAASIYRTFYPEYWDSSRTVASLSSKPFTS